MIQFEYVVAFLGGVFLLGLGADWLVRGAATIAEKFNMPKHVVGLTLVALGTSAPELFLNLIAAWQNQTGIALANVSGSNLTNVCVGFSLCALLGRVIAPREEFRVDLQLLVLAPLLVLVGFYTNSARTLPFWYVGLLTALLLYYLFSLRGRLAHDRDAVEAVGSTVLGFATFSLGVICLYAGGELVLSAALNFARSLEIGEDVIGLTIVAAGTSVPDVTASVVATRRKEYGIAVGNILGSNISNVLLVLNGTILVSGSALQTKEIPQVRLDYAVVCLTSLICYGAARRSGSISKPVGLLLMVLYIAYLAYRVLYLS
jgi:cation:H+ antiporter